VSIAAGIDWDRRPRFPGVETAYWESQSASRTFLPDLRELDLTGVELVVRMIVLASGH
jgi:transposase-like protein